MSTFIASTINNNYYHRGRLGNLFFVGFALHFISLKNNLYVRYQDHDKFIRLGIDWFVGENIYENTISLSDSNFFDLINGEAKEINVSIVNNVWCQTKEFSQYLMKYMNEEPQKSKVINNNIFRNRFNNNNDVYVHIRLGDVTNSFAHPLSYYDSALSKIKFNNGYISSDSISNDICQKLIEKYHLNVINYDEITTIMFATTCKYLVLSSGTYSWLIGLIAYYSAEIYYPKIYKKWHGDIFVFPEWHEVDYDNT